MTPTLTVDRAALIAFVFAVVAIITVSTVSVRALENLIAASARVPGMQRIISSLEAVRFHAPAIDNAERNDVLTGENRDRGRYRQGEVEMLAEMSYLANKRAELPILDAQYDLLRRHVDGIVEAQKNIVNARTASGFEAAKKLIRERAGLTLR